LLKWVFDSTPLKEPNDVTATDIRPIDLRKSPSYPDRVHSREGPQWRAVLKQWEDRIAQAGRQLASMGPGPDREARQRSYFQMLGARDQIAEAAARLPMEVGDMYEEDRHRLEAAVAALGRLFARWDGNG
jgi:hypothetical protein